MKHQNELAIDLENLWRSELHQSHSFAVTVTLDGQCLVSLASDQRFSGASMIKTLIALLVVRRVAADAMRWEDTCAVEDGMRAPGDGVLTGFTLPLRLSLANACFLMLAVSDNTATNAVIDVLGGLRVVNDELAALGLRSRVRRWVGGAQQDPRAADWTVEPCHINEAGLSVVVPSEHDWAIRSLVLDHGAHSERVASMLRGQQDRRSLARYLRDAPNFAHKTGTVDGVRHDGGLLFDPAGRRLEISVFTDGFARSENVDDVACTAMARGAARTLALLDWQEAPDDAYREFWQPPTRAEQVSVRPVGSGDATKVREIRLRMVRDTPQAFLETYSQATAHPATEWANRANEWGTAETAVAFAAADQWERWWGFAAGRVLDDSVLLYAMFVDPATRGRSIQAGSRLIEQVAHWARSKEREALSLWVLESNGRAQALYSRVGFTYTGQQRPYALDNKLIERQMIVAADEIAN